MSPNREYLELNYVAETATGRGTNEKVIMERIDDLTFRLVIGRVGIRVGRHKPKSFIKSMDIWDETYDRYHKKGYLVTKQQKMEAKKINSSGMNVNGKLFSSIEDESVGSIVEELLEAANQVIESNYSVTVEDISDEMFDYGQEILSDLSENYATMSIAQFNNKLKILYAAIPRRMDRIGDMLAKRKNDMPGIIARNQDLFDVIHGQLRNCRVDNEAGKTIIEAHGLEWKRVSEEEKAWIIRKLSPNGASYLDAWKITNERTEDQFTEFCRQEGLSEGNGIRHLFHGSRNENFWSIISNGLTINPSGVVITGKMFGNGTYFAPLSTKSMGYTSALGSYWADGGCPHGFMGIYKVATGKQYDIIHADCSLDWKRLQSVCPGAHCTWAHGREWDKNSQLYNDEVVVYKDDQSTIEYLVKFKA